MPVQCTVSIYQSNFPINIINISTEICWPHKTSIVNDPNQMIVNTVIVIQNACRASSVSSTTKYQHPSYACNWLGTNIEWESRLWLMIEPLDIMIVVISLSLSLAWQWRMYNVHYATIQCKKKWWSSTLCEMRSIAPYTQHSTRYNAHSIMIFVVMLSHILMCHIHALMVRVYARYACFTSMPMTKWTITLISLLLFGTCNVWLVLHECFVRSKRRSHTCYYDALRCIKIVMKWSMPGPCVIQFDSIETSLFRGSNWVRKMYDYMYVMTTWFIVINYTLFSSL